MGTAGTVTPAIKWQQCKRRMRLKATATDHSGEYNNGILEVMVAAIAEHKPAQSQLTT